MHRRVDAGTFAPELDPELTPSPVSANENTPENIEESMSCKPQSSHTSDEDDVEELSEEKRAKYDELIKK